MTDFECLFFKKEKKMEGVWLLFFFLYLFSMPFYLCGRLVFSSSKYTWTFAYYGTGNN